MKFSYAQLLKILEIKFQELGEPSHPADRHSATDNNRRNPCQGAGNRGNLISVNANVKTKI
jgi:hypothetical protein